MGVVDTLWFWHEYLLRHEINFSQHLVDKIWPTWYSDLTSIKPSIFRLVQLSFDDSEDILTLNVPSYCGPARPIAWALRGKCEGCAWTLRPTYRFAQLRPEQLSRGTRTLRACRAHRVARTPAYFAAHAGCGPRTSRPAQSAVPKLTVWPMQFAIHEICNLHVPKLRTIQPKTSTILRPKVRIRNSSITVATTTTGPLSVSFKLCQSRNLQFWQKCRLWNSGLGCVNNKRKLVQIGETANSPITNNIWVPDHLTFFA